MTEATSIRIQEREKPLRSSSSSRAAIHEPVPSFWQTSSRLDFANVLAFDADWLVFTHDFASDYVSMLKIFQPKEEWMRDTSRVPDVVTIYDHSYESEPWKWSLPILGYQPAWYQDTVDTMLELMELEHNWNGHGSMPLQQRFAEQGLRTLSKLIHLINSKPFFYPSASGGLITEIDRPSGRITFILDDSLAIIHKQGDEPVAFDLSHADDEAEMVIVLAEALRS